MLGFKEIQVEVFVGDEIIPLFHKSMNLDIIHQNYVLIKRKKLAWFKYEKWQCLF